MFYIFKSYKNTYFSKTTNFNNVSLHLKSFLNLFAFLCIWNTQHVFFLWNIKIKIGFYTTIYYILTECVRVYIYVCMSIRILVFFSLLFFCVKNIATFFSIAVFPYFCWTEIALNFKFINIFHMNTFSSSCILDTKNYSKKKKYEKTKCYFYLLKNKVYVCIYKWITYIYFVFVNTDCISELECMYVRMYVCMNVYQFSQGNICCLQFFRLSHKSNFMVYCTKNIKKENLALLF